MNIGMLWFDNDSQSDLAAKIERAAVYYQKKYGKRPNLCFVHPSMASLEPVNGQTAAKDEPAIKAGNVEIRTTRAVLPNHLWIGIHANGSGNGHATQ
jgi:hypothetical protein